MAASTLLPADRRQRVPCRWGRGRLVLGEPRPLPRHLDAPLPFIARGGTLPGFDVALDRTGVHAGKKMASPGTFSRPALMG